MANEKASSYADRLGNNGRPKQKTGQFGPVFCFLRLKSCWLRGWSGDLFDLLHFRHEMPKQVLDAVLQRRRR